MINSSYMKFLNYSFSSLVLFLVTLICFNVLIFFLKDKILAAQITFIISFFNYFLYYCFFYQIKKKLSFFPFYLLTSLLFRFIEYKCLTFLINENINHNIGLILVLGLSHTIKYFYYLTIIKVFKFS